MMMIRKYENKHETNDTCIARVPYLCLEYITQIFEELISSIMMDL